MPQTYKLEVCKQHKKIDCVECGNYLNEVLIREYDTKNTKEEIDKHRKKINNWMEENYKTITVVEVNESS